LVKNFEDKKKLEIFFLANDDDQSVEVYETLEVDIEEVNAFLKTGGSIYVRQTK
jgi:hypothetical protein